MRCKYCGSSTIHPEVRHKTFSAGKAAVGAVAFGVIGAAAGMIGKDIKGYQCGQCGAFMESAMDFSTEMSVNSAIREAERGGSRAMYDYFKSQYANIQANILVQSTGNIAPAQTFVPVQADVRFLAADTDSVTIKQSYRNLSWDSSCPAYIDTVTIFGGSDSDKLALLVYNQSKKTIRSAYYQVKVFDDTFDLIETVKCVYQGIEIAPGQALPADKQFDLKTDLAYKVEIDCEKIAFTDDEVWRCTGGEARILTEQAELTEDNFPRLRYVKRDLKNVSRADVNGKLYLPIKADGHWQCICKKPSLSGETCTNCGAEYEKLEELLSQTRLMEEQRKAVMERAAKRAEGTVAAYETARKEAYARALLLAEEQDEAAIKEAISLFKKLGDYEDSLARFAALSEALPATTAKIQEEKAAAEAKVLEEQQAQDAAEKAQQEQAEKAEKRKKSGKYFIMLIAFVLQLARGAILGTDYLPLRTAIIEILSAFGIPLMGAVSFISSAILASLGIIVAIIIYSLFSKQKFRFGRLIRAVLSVSSLTFIYTLVQQVIIIMLGFASWISIVGPIMSLLFYLRAGALYCKDKKKKLKKAK